MATINYPNPTISRELRHEVRSVRNLHEVNYGMIISSALIALALVALSWCISVSSDYTRQIHPINSPPNPTSDLANYQAK